jgi:hypothetical protein
MWKQSLFVASVAAVWHGASSLECSSLDPSSALPCLEIPRCSSGSSMITIDQLSTGEGPSQAYSEVTFCYDDLSLHITHTAYAQSSITSTSYNQCNDPIYYSNVMELFISPNMEQTPHCYNELDISPKNVLFTAGIYNPNLNATAIVGTTFSCETSGITSSVAVDETEKKWSAEMTFPFSLLNCPYACPLSRYCGHTTPNLIYRANLFRISELLSPVEKCSSTTCEYMAWSPTMRNPPAFHEPTKFGYLLLQGL